MNIHVGSTNKTKLQAVRDAIAMYPNLFPEPEIIGVDVSVEQFGHPKNLEQTMRGAIDRAKAAFESGNCAYGVGLESGLMEVPFSKSGFMEVSACALFDGKENSLGLSQAYEWPKKVQEKIMSGEADASQAFKQLGYTHHEKLGAETGGITGFLTKQRLTREDSIVDSIITALIQLENPELYM